MRWIRATSGEELRIEEGALYPALHRLEERGLVGSEWGLSENNRRAKFYALTGRGKRRLLSETASWSRPYLRDISAVNSEVSLAHEAFVPFQLA